MNRSTSKLPHFKGSKISKTNVEPIFNDLFTIKFDNSKLKIKEKKELESQILYINGSGNYNIIGIDFQMPVNIGFNLNVDQRGNVMPYETLLKMSKYDDTTIIVSIEDKRKKVFNKIVYSGCRIAINPFMMYNLSYDDHKNKTLDTSFEYDGCEIFNATGKSIYKKMCSKTISNKANLKKNKK